MLLPHSWFGCLPSLCRTLRWEVVLEFWFYRNKDMDNFPDECTLPAFRSQTHCVPARPAGMVPHEQTIQWFRTQRASSRISNSAVFQSEQGFWADKQGPQFPLVWVSWGRCRGPLGTVTAGCYTGSLSWGTSLQ